MAGKDFALRATPAAVTVIERLRGTARRSYAAFEAEPRKQGCRVAGYRLLGAEDVTQVAAEPLQPLLAVGRTRRGGTDARSVGGVRQVGS